MAAATEGDDLDAEIRRLELQLAALRREKADRTDAAFLLLLERDVTVGVVFSAADLIRHGHLHDELAAAIGDVAANVLGRRLARIARRAVLTRLAIEYVGRGEEGCIWVLRSTA
jgi:hypothetical protein